MNSLTFHSLSWQESQRRNNCTVKFRGHSSQSHYFGQTEHFAQLRNDSGALRLCAFIILLQCSTLFSSLPLPSEGFYAVERTTTLVLIEAIGLSNKCIHIHLGNRTYKVSLWTYLRRIRGITLSVACILISPSV